MRLPWLPGQNVAVIQHNVEDRPRTEQIDIFDTLHK